MHKVLLVLVAALSLVPAASAGRGPGPAKPLPADQAEPLITALGTGGTEVVPVSKAAALAGMQAAGATTTVDPAYGSVAAAVAASTVCASYHAWQGWGTFPYDHTIHTYTYFCAVYGDHITSYSTTVSTDQTLCSRSSVEHFTYSGGIGYSWVTVQSNATWSCPIIGVVPWSVSGWIRVAYNDWGNAEVVDHS